MKPDPSQSQQSKISNYSSKEGIRIQSCPNESQSLLNKEEQKVDLLPQAILEQSNMKEETLQEDGGDSLLSQESSRVRQFQEQCLQREQGLVNRLRQQPTSSSSRDKNERYVPGSYGGILPSSQPLKNFISSSMNVPFSVSAFQKIGAQNKSELEVSSLQKKASKMDTKLKVVPNFSNYIPISMRTTIDMISPSSAQKLKYFLPAGKKKEMSNYNESSEGGHSVSNDSHPKSAVNHQDDNASLKIEKKNEISKSVHKDLAYIENQYEYQSRFNYSLSLTDNLLLTQSKPKLYQNQKDFISFSSESLGNRYQNFSTPRQGAIDNQSPSKEGGTSINQQQDQVSKEEKSSTEPQQNLMSNREIKQSLNSLQSMKKQTTNFQKVFSSPISIQNPSREEVSKQQEQKILFNPEKPKSNGSKFIQSQPNPLFFNDNKVESNETAQNINTILKTRAGTAVHNRKMELNIETNNQTLHSNPSPAFQLVHPYQLSSSAKNIQSFQQNQKSPQNRSSSSTRSSIKLRDTPQIQRLANNNIPNFSTSSFSQLKSPVVQSKMFLSPQAKLSLGFHTYDTKSGSNNNSSTEISAQKKDGISILQQNIIPQSLSFSHQRNSLQELNQENKSNQQPPKQSTQTVSSGHFGSTSQPLNLHPNELNPSFSLLKDDLNSNRDYCSLSDDIPCQNICFSDISTTLADQIKSTIIPNHEPTRFSTKRNGIVKCYAANTNQGLIRNYNEDRVSIILNIMKPQGKSDTNIQWPKCSFFGVYDGHGGVKCADFLRDNLHQFVIKDSNFPQNPKIAIINGFQEAESQFLKESQITEGIVEKSGSCAIVVMIVGNKCYIANVGDSRAIMSGNGGTKAYDLSRDHKPLDEIEYKRINEAGGKIYQQGHQNNNQNSYLSLHFRTKIMNFQNAFSAAGTSSQGNVPQPIYGPHRVLPGRLSVTRTFGDIEAKLKRLGGNPNVVIAVPDVKEFEITKDHDFIVLASKINTQNLLNYQNLFISGDGIFDKLSTKEAIASFWNEARQSLSKYKNVHEFGGLVVDNLLKFSLCRKSMDNVTVVLIGFDNFKSSLFPKDQSQLQIKEQDEQSIEQQERKQECLNSFENALVSQQGSLKIAGKSRLKSGNKSSGMIEAISSGFPLSVKQNSQKVVNDQIIQSISQRDKINKFIADPDYQSKNQGKQQPAFFHQPLSHLANNGQSNNNNLKQKSPNNKTERSKQFTHSVGQNLSFHLNENPSARYLPSYSKIINQFPINSTKNKETNSFQSSGQKQIEVPQGQIKSLCFQEIGINGNSGLKYKITPYYPQSEIKKSCDTVKLERW